MNHAAMCDIVSRIHFPGFFFVVSTNGYLQIECEDHCNVTGQPMSWKSRKWLLSQYMTTSEVVQTAFKAVLTALEHEARERFTYRGATIFGPHFDVERLVALAHDETSEDVRAAA